MDCSTPGLPVHHQLPEFTQTHVHWVGDAIQPSHPLSSPSPPALSLSQHQGLLKWVSSSHQVAKVLEHAFKAPSSGRVENGRLKGRQWKPPVKDGRCYRSASEQWWGPSLDAAEKLWVGKESLQDIGINGISDAPQVDMSGDKMFTNAAGAPSAQGKKLLIVTGLCQQKSI